MKFFEDGRRFGFIRPDATDRGKGALYCVFLCHPIIFYVHSDAIRGADTLFGDEYDGQRVSFHFVTDGNGRAKAINV